MIDYDAVIIGSGTAGQTAAYALKAKGMHVVVVEKSDRPGGTCSLAGCQPKKWFSKARRSLPNPTIWMAEAFCLSPGWPGPIFSGRRTASPKRCRAAP